MRPKKKPDTIANSKFDLMYLGYAVISVRGVNPLAIETDDDL